MELEDLLVDSSKITAEMAVHTIGENPVLFKKVLDFALEDKEQYAMRAARVIHLTATSHPELIKPYLIQIIQALPGFKTNGLKRSMTRMLTEHCTEIDEESQGILIDVCFNNLMDLNEKIVLKIYSMDILYEISQQYPEIKRELISSIETQLPYSSNAFKSRGKKMIKKLYKEIQN